jgi:hypothetical protein
MTLRACKGALFLVAAASAAMPAAAAITFDSDPVLYWNERMTSLYVASAPVQARAFAMANIAMHDAVNASLGSPNRFYTSAGGSAGGDPRAAAAQAAHDVLVALNPANAAAYGAALTNSLNLVADGTAKDIGKANGAAYALAILTSRGADGSSNPLGVMYTPASDPGAYVPTTLGVGAALPFWGEVSPFVLASGDEVRAAPPPLLDSAAYAAAFNEVKELGSLTSSTRTDDQRASALFWDAANASPWMQIGLAVAEDEGMSTLALASAFGRLSTGLADALIAGFDSKYEYALWRPITAIRNADLDGNPDTLQDISWTSLFPAPVHPSYVSTHSALSGAGATILSDIFGDDQPFSLTIAGDTRAFTSLAAAAQDGADSRLYGGIHFRFDNEAGLAMGQEIGRRSLAQGAFGAVPEPTTWALMISGFGLVGTALRRRRPRRAGEAMG